MNTTINENDENVREVNTNALLKNVLSYEKGNSPKSAYEMGNIFNLPLKLKGKQNTFSQKPIRKTVPKAFGKLPNFTKKGGRRRKVRKGGKKTMRRK